MGTAGSQCLIFVYEAGLATGALENFITEHVVIPQEIISAVDLHTLLTSMFLHSGWMDLIGNMLFLWVFSNNIETVLGTPLHLGFYLAGGLAASLAHILSDPSSTIPSVGASGAIAAILGAYLMLFPRSRVKLLVFTGYTMGVTRANAIVFLGLWAVMQLFSGVASLGVTTAQTGGVAWWAHIGGFGFGLVVGWLVKGRAASRHAVGSWPSRRERGPNDGLSTTSR